MHNSIHYRIISDRQYLHTTLDLLPIEIAHAIRTRQGDTKVELLNKNQDVTVPEALLTAAKQMQIDLSSSRQQRRRVWDHGTLQHRAKTLADRAWRKVQDIVWPNKRHYVSTTYEAANFVAELPDREEPTTAHWVVSHTLTLTHHRLNGLMSTRWKGADCPILTAKEQHGPAFEEHGVRVFYCCLGQQRRDHVEYHGVFLAMQNHTLIHGVSTTAMGAIRACDKNTISNMSEMIRSE